MFGFSYISRHATRWHANHKRNALERMMIDLPRELQKDIGWPAPAEAPSVNRVQADIQTRPML